MSEQPKSAADLTPDQKRAFQDRARRKLAEAGVLFSSSTGKEYELRGGCKDLVTSTEQQVIISGPADTGKTVASCLKLHGRALTHPKSQHVIARKTYESMGASVLQTWERIVAGTGVETYGGKKPQWYDYPNGSRVWAVGLDNPGKALSTERDSIYVNQAEELTVDDWETLSTRVTGRNAVIPHVQLFGDCNPAGSKHWIRESAKVGTIRLLFATHKDNPTIYNEDGSLTASGRLRMSTLEKLTGVRRKRLFEGIWATAEGAVYENFDVRIHAKKRDPNEMVLWYLAMDEGFTNPQVTLLIGADADKRWHIFMEFYVTGRLETEIVGHAKGWWSDVSTAQMMVKRGETEYIVKMPPMLVVSTQCRLCAVDNAAPGLIKALNAAGVWAKGGKGVLIETAYNTAKGQISGISKIQDRLKVQADGRPRLTIDPDCVETINEFESYQWEKGKDIPKDENNHSMGALRYLEDVVGQGTGAFDNASLAQSSSGGQGSGVGSDFEFPQLDIPM